MNARESLGDPRRLGLLEHDLADEHGIRVAVSAPRKVAVVGRVPVEQERDAAHGWRA